MALSKPAEAKQFTDDDLITCGICHIEIQHPRSLLCLHTYCLGCLREWSKTRKDAVICPLCRETTPLPHDGVDGLRSNFFVTKLKDRKVLSRQLMEKDVKIMCTSCDVSDMNEAVARCVECDDFLCDKCVKAHKSLRSVKNHIVITLDDLRSGKASFDQQSKEECCIEHKGQVLWFFCQTCGVPICLNCTVVDHPTSSHDLVKLKVAIVGQRDEIRKLASSCEEKHHAIQTSQEEVQVIGKQLEDASASAYTAIDAASENLKKSITNEIDKQCDELKAKVSQIRSGQEKKLSEFSDKLEVLQTRFNSALEMAKQVTENGSDCEVASVYSALTSTLKQQLQNVLPPLETSRNLAKVVFVDRSTTVGLTGTIGNVSHVSGSRKENKYRVGSTWRLDRKFGEAGEGKLKDARGIASIGDEKEIAVADYDQNTAKVYIYDVADGNLERVIDTTKGLHSNPSYYTSCPSNVVEHCDGSLIVTDWTKFPTIYDSKGKYIRQLVPDHGNLVKGIATTVNGQVLIGNGQSKRIDVLNYADGKSTSILNVHFIPNYITVSSTNDQIIISADSTSGAQVIDNKGNTIHKLRPPKDATAKWCPTGVCTSGEGDEEDVYICNREGTPGVYRFSLTTGKYLGCVTTELREPHGITFIGDELFVADKTYVKVFKCVD